MASSAGLLWEMTGWGRGFESDNGRHVASSMPTRYFVKMWRNVSVVASGIKGAEPALGPARAPAG